MTASINRQEALHQFKLALKAGQKCYRDCVHRGRDPYPQVLEELLQGGVVAGRVDLGELEIPIAQIVGMNTAGRQTAFAANFMPLLDLGTEFASKWISLCEAHLGDTGIVDPIRCFEYMGQFYVQEGNKRVSVLRSFGAPTIRAYVTRVLPLYSDDPAVRVYYEFLHFYERCGLYQVHFNRLGDYPKLQAALGFDAEHVWSQLERRAFLTAFYTFKTAYDKLTQSAPPVTTAEALLTWLHAYTLGDLRVLELPFTHELAALSPEEFVRQHLLPLRLKHLVIGHDFTLGRGRSGQPDVLRSLGEKYGFDVDQLPPVEVGGHVVSSTCLRELIGKGDVATAASLLGHAYGCEGLVVHGEGRGTGLGFPTANIAIPDTMLPAPGVYATRVVVPHLGKTLQAVTNIGRKPTFGDYGLSIESFLLDTDLNLYGNELRLDFVARLRDEKRFESADALVAQIRTDVARARDLLTMYF